MRKRNGGTREEKGKERERRGKEAVRSERTRQRDIAYFIEGCARLYLFRD
jgi:hypothetical protein